jgi:hypothetical protein
MVGLCLALLQARARAYAVVHACAAQLALRVRGGTVRLLFVMQ